MNNQITNYFVKEQSYYNQNTPKIQHQNYKVQGSLNVVKLVNAQCQVHYLNFFNLACFDFYSTYSRK